MDLLFEGGATAESLKEVFSKFIESGFMRSAKHEFQLLKVMHIDGSDFIFNVDFLHPSETSKGFDMLVKQVEWPEYTDAARQKHFMAKSIALPSSQLVFDHGLYVNYEHKYKANSCGFKLINAVGILVTKAESYKSPKRPRDAYDLMLAAIYIENCAESKADLTRLRQKSDVADTLFSTMAEILCKDSDHFDHNVVTYDCKLLNASSKLIDILNDTERSV